MQVAAAAADAAVCVAALERRQAAKAAKTLKVAWERAATAKTKADARATSRRRRGQPGEPDDGKQEAEEGTDSEEEASAARRKPSAASAVAAAVAAMQASASSEPAEAEQTEAEAEASTGVVMMEATTTEALEEEEAAAVLEEATPEAEAIRPALSAEQAQDLAALDAMSHLSMELSACDLLVRATIPLRGVV